MNNKYIEQLSNLYMEQKVLKRQLDIVLDKKKRRNIYDKINDNENKIKIIKKKIRLLKEINRND